MKYKNIMDKLALMYPDASVQGEFLIIEVLESVFVMFSEDIENNEYNAWNTKGDDLTSKLTCSINEIKNIPHNKEDKLILILQSFKDQFGKIAGFDTTDSDNNNELNIPDYDGDSDRIWSIIRSKFNVDTTRKLHIYTYGTRFVFEQPVKSQQSFNSCVLRGSSYKDKSEKNTISHKVMAKLRGTNLKIQQEVRDATLFKTFVEDIVQNIETKNLSTISIFCTAGHHRSVSCAEMLVHLYPNRTVEHLTINT